MPVKLVVNQAKYSSAVQRVGAGEPAAVVVTLGLRLFATFEDHATILSQVIEIGADHRPVVEMRGNEMHLAIGIAPGSGRCVRHIPLLAAHSFPAIDHLG